MYEFFTESKEKLKTWMSEKIAAKTDPETGTNDQPFQGLSFNRYSLSSKCMPGTTLDPVTDMMLVLQGKRKGTVKQAFTKEEMMETGLYMRVGRREKSMDKYTKMSKRIAGIQGRDSGAIGRERYQRALCPIPKTKGEF